MAHRSLSVFGVLVQIKIHQDLLRKLHVPEKTQNTGVWEFTGTSIPQRVLIKTSTFQQIARQLMPLSSRPRRGLGKPCAWWYGMIDRSSRIKDSGCHLWTRNGEFPAGSQRKWLQPSCLKHCRLQFLIKCQRPGHRRPCRPMGIWIMGT
jgi:hypothetical protein